MGTDTKIEYVNHSMNFWKGCNKVSAGCLNCFAADNAELYGWDFSKVQGTSRATWHQPFVKSHDTREYKWKPGERIFVCSLSDFFHKDADEWRRSAMQVIKDRPDLVWLIVTKRIERATDDINFISGDFTQKNYPNLWIIPTCENQEMANKRIPPALELKAKYPWIKIGVSIEPMLEEIDLSYHGLGITCPTCGGKGEITDPEHWMHPNQTGDAEGETWCLDCNDLTAGINGVVIGIDQVFIGCESGPKRRPCNIEDVRSIVDQGEAANTACFVKQLDIDGRFVKDPQIIKRLGFPQELANR